MESGLLMTLLTHASLGLPNSDFPWHETSKLLSCFSYLLLGFVTCSWETIPTIHSSEPIERPRVNLPGTGKVTTLKFPFTIMLDRSFRETGNPHRWNPQRSSSPLIFNCFQNFQIKYFHLLNLGILPIFGRGNCVKCFICFPKHLEHFVILLTFYMFCDYYVVLSIQCSLLMFTHVFTLYLSGSNLRSFIYVHTHTHIFLSLSTGSALLSECLSIAF